MDVGRAHFRQTMARRSAEGHGCVRQQDAKAVDQRERQRGPVPQASTQPPQGPAASPHRQESLKAYKTEAKTSLILVKDAGGTVGQFLYSLN